MRFRAGPGRPGSVRAVGAAVLVAAVGLLGACRPAAEPEASASPTAPSASPEVPSPEPTSTPEVPPGLEEVYAQELDWDACTEPDLGGLECAWLTVPMDYADPGGQTIEIALARSAAENGQGSLVFNPGGPGASGVDQLPSVVEGAGEKVTDTFDVVSFDPRGVMRSAPVTCGLDEATLERITFDTDVSTPDGWAEAAAMWAEIGEGCAAGTGELLGHVDTISAARDMDVLRVALGESSLTYLGFSYGTRLGQTYAALFPQRVGRFVLDSAFPMAVTPAQQVAASARETEQELRAYAADCLQQAECPWHGSVDDAVAQIGEVMDAAPRLDTGEDRRLTSTQVFAVVSTLVRYPELWEELSSALQAAVDGDGAPLLEWLDILRAIQRGEVDDEGTPSEPAGDLPPSDVADIIQGETDGDVPRPQPFDDGPSPDLADFIQGMADDADPFLMAMQAIQCADGRGDPADAQAAAMAAAPTVGKYFAWQAGTGVVCESWPTPEVEPLPSYAADGAPPIVVVGNTGDLRTPYSWTQLMAESFSAAVLVTADGDQHGVYLGGNGCIDDLVEARLVDGTLPPEGVTCTG